MESDLLGFRKNYEHLSKEKQIEIETRNDTRKIHVANEWKSLLQPGNQLHRSHSLKKMFRKGVPDSERPRIWFKYSGAERLYKSNTGLYSLLTGLEAMDINQALNDKLKNTIFEHLEIIDRG